MPLNLQSAASEEGEFFDKLRFNAQGGVWYVKQNGEEKRFASGFKAIFDMATLSTGWARFNGSFLDFVADPSLEQPAAMPVMDAADEDRWKRSFKVFVFSQDAFGGIVEFTHSARTVTSSFNELYANYEQQAADGMVPVVEVGGDPQKVGDYYAPTWSIMKMVKRPATLPDGAAPAPVAAAPVASKAYRASLVGAAPAPAPAPVAVDDEF